jgi:Zn-dependent protease with chaperone function
MLKIRNPSKYSFWLLIVVALILAGLGLTHINWQYRQGWVQAIWHICQSGVQNLGQHWSVTWQLVILAIAFVVIVRGGWSIGQQVRSTRRFVRLFLPLRETPPARLRTLLEAHNLSAENIVYLNLTVPHAFCLGFWRPRIWLTSDLINLLSDEELTVVLAHEVYHCRRRDPLRLLISRALKSAFFFLPLVGDLANFVELQQEIAADQSVIEYLGDDLPLLCTLQKLLTQDMKGTPLPSATFTPFNVTEARLRRLIYPSQSTPFSWRDTMANWAINVGMVMFVWLCSYVVLAFYRLNRWLNTKRLGLALSRSRPISCKLS